MYTCIIAYNIVYKALVGCIMNNHYNVNIVQGQNMTVKCLASVLDFMILR